jgi:hypothetical protein
LVRSFLGRLRRQLLEGDGINTKPQEFLVLRLFLLVCFDLPLHLLIDGLSGEPLPFDLSLTFFDPLNVLLAALNLLPFLPEGL